MPGTRELGRGIIPLILVQMELVRSPLASFQRVDANAMVVQYIESEPTPRSCRVLKDYDNG